METKASRAKSIFIELLGKVQPEQWSSHLEECCGDDLDLRQEVQSLLAAHLPDDSFLAQPAGAVVATVDAPLVEKLGDTIGPYKLREQIGEGGMGVVYVAEQTEPVKRKVALKIIKPGMATRDVVARFEAERQALAMMDYPNIAKVFDAGATESGQPYFVMELVQGPPIDDYCDQRQHTTRQRLELVERVCRAVQHAHQKGIIHRDLKPSNVLVPEVDGAPVPKVIDFGVAKAVDQKLTEQTVYTQFSQLVGTPQYMSPEQAGLGVIDIDTRSDVYSLGVLLYELLTGSTPFDSDTLKNAGFDEMRRIIREEEPPKPSARVSTLKADALSTVSTNRGIDPRKLNASIKGELDWIVMKCLEKDRHRRYASAKDLADDIERNLADEPVLARPTSSIYRIRKFTRRNRALVASVAAVLVALSLGLLSTIVALRNAQEQRDIAQQRLVDVTEERANYETVTQLVRDMYDVPWGQSVETKELRVRDLLERLSDGLNERAPDRPTVEIELRRIVSNMYRMIGEFDEARAHLQRALELAEGEGGYDPHEEKYADLLVDFAMQVDWSDGEPWNPQETADCARRALEIYDELGIEKQATADACFALARSLGYSSPLPSPEREQLLRRALRVTERLRQGSDPARRIFARIDLARYLSNSDAEGSDEAIQYARQAVELGEKAYGKEGPMTALAYKWLGHCYFRRGQINQAIGSFQVARNIYWETRREQEIDAHNAAFRLAEANLFAGRHNEANGVLEKLEETCREVEGGASLANCHYFRGWGDFVRGDYRAAEQSFVNALNVPGLSPYHEAKVYSSWYRIRSLDALGQTPEAQVESERFLEAISAWSETSFGELPLVRYAHAWGLVRANSDDAASLTTALDKAKLGLDLVTKIPEEISEAPFLWVQAQAEYKLNRKDDAIKSLEEAIRRITKPYPSILGNGFAAYGFPSKDIPRPRWEMEATLAEYYLADGRFEDAEKVYTAGIRSRKKFSEEEFPAKRLQVALAELRYGEFLVEQGRFDQAEQPLLSAYKKLSENPEAAQATAQRAAAQLAEVYEATDRPEVAAQWHQKLVGSESARGNNDSR